MFTNIAVPGKGGLNGLRVVASGVQENGVQVGGKQRTEF